MKNFIENLTKVIDEFGGAKHLKGCIVALNFDNGGKHGTDAYLTINGEQEVIMGHLLAIIMEIATDKGISALELLPALEQAVLEAMSDEDIIKLLNKGEK